MAIRFTYEVSTPDGYSATEDAFFDSPFDFIKCLSRWNLAGNPQWTYKALDAVGALPTSEESERLFRVYDGSVPRSLLDKYGMFNSPYGRRQRDLQGF